MRQSIQWVLACALLLAHWACDDAPAPEPPAPTPISWRTTFDATDQGALMSVWGTSGQDVWAVGGQLDAGVAWHYNAQEWTPVEVPAGPLLNWVHGADGVLWMVGNEGRILRREDFEPFEVVESGVTQDLWGVWAASGDRAWAVGGDANATMTDPDPVVLEWNGTAWRQIALPPLDRDIRALFKVWGTSADQVFAVGEKGVIVRYDGAEWKQTIAGTPRDFVSLWGTSPDDIVAVGGRQNGMVARWNGERWTTEVLEGEPGLNGCFVDQEGVAHLVGQRGRVLQMAPGGFAVQRDENTDRTLLHAVWGHRTGLFAVGGTLDRTPPWAGVALESVP